MIATFKETYKGDYQVNFISARASDNGMVQTAGVKKIKLLGPPFCVLCFENKKDKRPALIVPLERLYGIYIRDKKGHLQQVSAITKLEQP